MKEDIENEIDSVDYAKDDKEYIKMEVDDFSISTDLEVVPYLNNNSDDLQDELNEIEKNTKNIQDNLVSEDDENVEYIDFTKRDKKSE